MFAHQFDTTQQIFQQEITRQTDVFNDIIKTLADADPSMKVGLPQEWFDDIDEICLWGDAISPRHNHQQSYGSIRA
ncbi:MAG: hypothetical protein FWD57_13080 [Polyangiaceae bacterium]|nr:hypothetical protein [Polyangiaceae bacterium]